jgi:hypothetical protein
MKSILTAFALTTGLAMSAHAADLIEVKTDKSVAEAMDACARAPLSKIMPAGVR